MKSEQVRQIVDQENLSNPSSAYELVETHISWVILTPEFVYKIKKPMQYSFLDFSTLERRKYYCEREVELNQRLTRDMYLGVVPVRQQSGSLTIEGREGTIAGYAVKMRRMDESRQMDLLLQSGEVNDQHIRQLAELLADFHATAEVVKTEPDTERMQSDFADILKVTPFIGLQLGEQLAAEVEKIVDFSARFLKRYTTRILERHRRGFTIDGHGDLHSKNIFLLDEPVVFDCIEFSDHLRQLDVLSELAFFCMDLDVFGRTDLETLFLQCYSERHPCMFDEKDRLLFQYFKLYRANVRMKVNTLKASQATEVTEIKKRIGLAEDYFILMKKYFSCFPALSTV